MVTGASSGIGRAFAQRLAADNYNLIITARNEARLGELADILTKKYGVSVEVAVADLSRDEDIHQLAEVCKTQPLEILINCAGLAHYMPFEQLSSEQASELVKIKELAPTLLTLAAVPGMLERNKGSVINVAGMIAFSGPAGPEQMPRRALYTGTLAHLVAWTQQLNAEFSSRGLHFQVLCPGIVATEFHTRQGMDFSSMPRMSADDVVKASFRGFEFGEVVCAPGVDREDLLQAVFASQLAAFGAQSPSLAKRYQSKTIVQ